MVKSAFKVSRAIETLVFQLVPVLSQYLFGYKYALAVNVKQGIDWYKLYLFFHTELLTGTTLTLIIFEPILVEFTDADEICYLPLYFYHMLFPQVSFQSLPWNHVMLLVAYYYALNISFCHCSSLHSAFDMHW